MRHAIGFTRIIPLALTALVLFGCPSEPNPSPDAVNGGRGGGGGSGGGGAGGSGGAGGTGGRGGSGGSGGSADAGRMDRPAADRGADRPGSDAGVTDGGNAGGGLDQCFEGLRAGVGRFQLSTKASADGKIRMRIAMEDGGGFGTSGSIPWKPMRLGLEINGANLCFTNEAELRAGYMQTQLHNCRDVLTVESGGRRYQIVSPDTRQGGTSDDRTVATLTVFMGDTMAVGPVLSTVSCVTKTPGQACSSGGPCQN
jgi:hypothetical protein